ncbi:glycoside hydrolase family 32 protein [Mangrovibacterium lignilyticum]|uniref:glycoside hydrolase family 32 protein n=1 Tax=Mangrovibacterium lignilyticum TaxID=2668052 RepID=UPI0013D3766E|nr:glycoside hydrolase family 32 protein [Mangrovibacterium lignilyticum]
MNLKHLNYFAVFFLLISWACSSNSKKQVIAEQDKASIEQYRPQYHFTPDSAWMNDPNGMVYYEGEYHLFYQYYPDSTVWGPMHWGHAISTDLVHWEHMPIALYPDSLGYIFSGSAVVDWKNTSGFGTAENPPLIAIFTYHNPEIAEAGGVDVESQGIAYSLDKGRSWTKYDTNPVIPNDGNRDFRDPNVIWNEEIQKWNLVLSAHDHVQIYSSDNLKQWSYESSFGADAGAHGGVWECPDLFPLQVEGTDDTKWVLIVNINPGGPNGGSGTQYFIGDFDGHQFTADSKETSWIDYGRDNYAGVTWSDVPKEDGRRIFLGWMSNWDYAQVVPTEKWRSAMTLPRVLSLAKVNDNYVVKSTPVKEMDLITDRKLPVQNEALEISGERELDLHGINLNQSRLSLEFETSENAPESFGLVFENELGENVKFSYSSVDKQFYFDRNHSGDMGFSDKFAGIDKASYEAYSQIKLEIFVDAASMEIFVDDGELVMTEIFFSTKPFTKLTVFSNGSPLTLTKSEFVDVNSIW